MVDPGNLVKADDSVLTSVVSLDPLYVYFDVHEQALLRIRRLIRDGKVKAQGEKEVTVQIALADEKEFPHEGIVDFTDNRVDPNTGTLRFRAKIENPQDRNGNRIFIPGLFVRVRLPIGDPHPALLIPEQSLVSDQGRKQIWVVRPKKDTQGNPLTKDKGQTICQVEEPKDVGNPGVLREGFREIVKGVQPGDWVVVNGMQRLRPGIEVYAEKVKPQPSGEPDPTKKEATRPPVSQPAGATAKQTLADVVPPAGNASQGAPAQPGSSVKADSSRSIAPSVPPSGSANRSGKAPRAAG
jgi:RND family efflux transporter MFP subunit